MVNKFIFAISDTDREEGHESDQDLSDSNLQPMSPEGTETLDDTTGSLICQLVKCLLHVNFEYPIHCNCFFSSSCRDSDI